MHFVDNLTVSHLAAGNFGLKSSFSRFFHHAFLLEENMKKKVKKAGKWKKRVMTLCLVAAMLANADASSAVEFKISGEWLIGFGAGSGELYSHYRVPGHGPKVKTNNNDIFEANQRFRIQLEAVASESLSGVVGFEIGDQRWGLAEEGGALGADGKNVIKVKNAYIDWMVPDTELSVRMGLQAIALPNAAGGSAIMDGDVAGIVASYKINDNVSLTGIWMRPVNDNFNEDYFNSDSDRGGYLDNMDLFAITLPISLDGFQITPWLMYGMLGKNALRGLDSVNENEPWETSDGVLGLTVPGLTPGFNYNYSSPLTATSTDKSYGSMFWAGLPITISAWDPVNIEFDINYGFVEEMGRFDIRKNGNRSDMVRGSTQRQGWLVKALAEYKMEWGTPGIFGWYSSGDDGNVKNGSERLPSIAGAGNFTSFIGDGNLAWGSFDDSCDWSMSYAGTWGIGLQLRDMSFLEDISHTFRVAWWGGTNSPAMVKYMESAYSWRDGYGGDGPYLTTNDGLLEFNLVNQWQMYENLELNLELGYVVNFMDQDTWQKSASYNGHGNGSFEKQDAWKAQLTFAYTF